MRSADRKLLPREVSRKRKKLDKTLSQLEGLKEGTRKHHRKMFKAEKTLDQIRTGKSGIRPNKSPLREGHEVNKDSIASSNAWKEFKKGYMDRGNKTPEENEKEYNMEKNEFYYDTERGKLRLIPTDDGEVQDRSGIEKWQLAPSMKSPMKSRGSRKDHDMGPKNWAAHKKTMHGMRDHGGPSMKSPLKMAGVGVNTPLMGKKDACYHKVKSRVKVWPSAYASGQLVQCRKAGAANWGSKSKKK